MLWVDKHSPLWLDELSVHPELSHLLLKQAASPSLPHLLFYGPSGAGKKTRALALVRQIFGEAVSKVHVETFADKETGTEATVCRSPHHILLSCMEFGLKDRAIVQSIIKDIAESTPVSGGLSSSFFTPVKAVNTPPFKICIFQDADLLSDGAQHALRRTLETYSSRLKFIFLVERIERLSSPLKSRCFCIRVPLPSHREVVSVLRSVCSKEGITTEMAPDVFLQTISQQSHRNLRRSVLALESIATQNFTSSSPSALSESDMAKLKSKPFVFPTSENSPFPLPWERLADEIGIRVYRQQNPRSLAECRGMVYDLLAVLIPGDLIISRVLDKLLKLVKFPKSIASGAGGGRGGGKSPSLQTSQSMRFSNSQNTPTRGGSGVGGQGQQGGGGGNESIELTSMLVHAAAHFSHTLKKGSKEVIHVEAFLAQAMRLLKLAGVGGAD
ncbi:replication factor c subunit [Cystoisospora suis]|uniref:Replication factor c subunit n=1 Tax=Cystoisospora suis TaxID=483139 RepID=A0A2C6L7J2_9APIC|nr:replication factor c subunit [Cystoisospora suis]